MRKSKVAKRISALLMGACILASASPALFTANADMVDYAGKFYLDYNSFEDAKAAAEKLNIELSAEGTVMLKNDGSLPLTGNESVSVFGCIEDQLQNNTQVSDSVSTAFAKAGFNVNNTLAEFYRAHNRRDAVIHQEPLNFSKSVENSLDLYNDLAIIIVGRAGSEMNDLDAVIKEEEKETYLGEDQGWEHEDLFYGNDLSYLEQDDAEAPKYKHKHENQLSDSEQALIKYVESQNFKHIIFVVNSSSAFETYNIEQDEKINAAFWIGRTGETGIHALPQIVKGAVTPSGKVADEWYKDFTADPVWQNFGTLEQQFGFAKTGVPYDNILTGKPATATQYPNNYLYPDGKNTSDLQAPRYNGFNGTDYEEDIYAGSKYVETYYQDIYNGKQEIPAKYEGMTKEEAAKAWYEDTVTHPFGQGLSYTNFSMNIDEVYVDEAKTITFAQALANPDDFASSVGLVQKYKKLYIDVEVENIGKDYSGKEVVELYVNAPYYEGEVEKSAMKLVGFTKTSLLKPGQSETVTVEINVQDMASYDYSDANANGTMGYELDAGNYILYASNSSHVDLSATGNNDAQDAYEFTLDKDVYQQLDDFSDREIKNAFSDAELGITNTQYNSIRNDALNGSTFKVNNGENAAMTQFSRSTAKGGFVGTYPAPPTKEDLTFSQDMVNDVLYGSRFDADFIVEGKDGKPVSFYDESEGEWYVESVPEDWTQAATPVEGVNEYRLADVAGLDPESEEPVPATSKFYVKDAETQMTQKKAWTTFMNQLTWDEVKQVVEDNSFKTTALPSIDKEVGNDQDRPNMLAGTHNWCCEVVIASTFNTELAEKEGIITANMGILIGRTGWYGPGMNMHRSAFSGRNNDYYSQDGIHAGYMATAVVKGAQSRGLLCYIKHFAMNDQDVTRNGWVHFYWASEQVIRESTLVAFQMPMQEGGAAGAMSGFARICGDACNINYRLETTIARDQWGYKGTFITDAQPGSKATAAADLMIRTGNDMFLRNNNVTDNYNRWYISGVWSTELRGGKGGVLVGGAASEGMKFVYAPKTTIEGDDAVGINASIESVNQYYYARTCAQRILYMAANSNMAKNGVNFVEWKAGATVETTRGLNVTVSNGIATEDLAGSTDVAYAVTKGELPAGITLNASTGVISGVPTAAAGNYTFEVTATVDGYISKTAAYTVKVAEAFALSENSGKVGEEFYATVDTTVINEDNGYASVAYTATGLPAGLTVSETGVIEGTPTEAGEFTVTVTATAGKTVFTNEYVLTIAEADPVEEPAPQFRVNENGMIQYSEDGGKTWIDVIEKSELKGDKGETGAKGETGEKGETGAKGEAGKDGKDGQDALAALGCSGSIAGSALAISAILAVASVAIAKRKED